MQSHDEFFSVAFYRPLVFNGIRILFILLFAYVAITLSRRIIEGVRNSAVKVMLRSGSGTEYELQKRADTVGGAVRKALAALIWVVALIMILQEMNFDVRPLLAGAGVAGLAIGFGAQNLVKDVLSGFFMLLDNQIRVNDVVVINGQGGLVEEMNLRTTILRSEDGAVHMFPNGGITKLSNLTREYSYAVIAVSVDYSADTDRVVAALGSIAAELAAEEPYSAVLLAPWELMGVDQLGDSGVVVKGRLKTLPMKQWMIGREMNRRIKKKFEQADVAIPFPMRTVHVEQELPGQWKDEMRAVVRELLDERRAPMG